MSGSSFHVTYPERRNKKKIKKKTADPQLSSRGYLSLTATQKSACYIPVSSHWTYASRDGDSEGR